MNNPIQDYLCAEYLSLEQLAQRAGIKAERVLELAETQCIPMHSYTLESTQSIHCNLAGQHGIDSIGIKYFNPSIVNWIAKAEELAKNKNLTEVAQCIRNEFNQAFEKYFAGQVTPGCKGLDAAWRYFTNGTWGICLKVISVETMAQKELARLAIQKLLAKYKTDEELSPEDKQALSAHIEAYEAVTKIFCPHLVKQSSRNQEINPARLRLWRCFSCYICCTARSN